MCGGLVCGRLLLEGQEELGQGDHLSLGGDKLSRLVQRRPEGDGQIALGAEVPPLGDFRLGGHHRPDLLVALPQQRLHLLQKGGAAGGAGVHEGNEPAVELGFIVALKDDMELIPQLLGHLSVGLGVPAFEPLVVIEGTQYCVDGVHLLQELPGQSLLVQGVQLCGQEPALETAVDTLLFHAGEEFGRGLIVTAAVIGADFGQIPLPHGLPEGGVQAVRAAVVLRLREENLAGELEVELPEVGALEKILEFFPTGGLKPALCGKGEGDVFFRERGAGPEGLLHRGGGFLR